MRRRVARMRRRRRAARRRAALAVSDCCRHTCTPRGCNGLVGTRASVCIRRQRSSGQVAELAQLLMSSFAVRASTSSVVVASLGTPAAQPSSVRRRPSLIRNAPVFAVPATLVGMDAVERLKVGFQKFKTEVYDKKPELFEPLKAGQAPKYMVFACADSRVCPSVTLGLQPGEAFMVRNIAAMVPPYDKTKYTGTGSAIEYAVCALKVQVLVVIGHSCCGGIRALHSLKDDAPHSFHFVEDWVRLGSPASTKVKKEHGSVPFDDQCSILEKEAVNVSLANLKTYPFVKERVANGTLKLVGAHYDFVKAQFLTWEPPVDAVERLTSGFEKFKVEVYDKKPELFEPLKAGQSPTYMVFACADSRVCPSVTLGLMPGEAFMVRNIAALVPGYDKTKYTGIGSAIEYAVTALKVKVLVVIGHSCCGGIRALLSLQDGAPDNFHFVEDWVKIGFPAKMKVKKEHASVPFDDQCGILEKEAVNVSLENLKTYPFVKEGLANGTLKLVGGHYDFVKGEFLTWKV